MPEYIRPCGGKLGVVTDTTGVARGWVDWELLILWVFCNTQRSTLKVKHTMLVWKLEAKEVSNNFLECNL